MLTYRVTPENDLMQVYNGEDVGTLGVRLAPDTAALFAASPKMLRALEEMLGPEGPHAPRRTLAEAEVLRANARAAIAEAKGGAQ